MIWDRKQKQ